MPGPRRCALRRAQVFCLVLVGVHSAAALRPPNRQPSGARPQKQERSFTQLFDEESSLRKINPYAVFGWFVLFGQVTPGLLTAAGRAGLWDAPPLNLFTDIANAAMESGVADGTVPKWRATLYGQDVWKDLLGQYYANGESTSFLTEAGGICAAHAEYCAGLSLH